MHPQFQRFAPESRDYMPPVVPEGYHMTHIPHSLKESSSNTFQAEVTNWYREAGEDVVADAAMFFKSEGVQVRKKLLEHSDPAERILKEAQAGKYDLLVIGRNAEEKEEKESPHLGGVAEKVARHAPSSVLIAARKKEISRLLVAVDGSEGALKASDYATALAHQFDAQMTLLYVQEKGLLTFRRPVSEEVGKKVLSEAAEKISGLKVEKRIESGDPAKRIVEVAKSGNHDIIVMGSRGYVSTERFKLGSVSNHVIHYADRSVLLVR
jgi:nucleotide-binding universal stress UspA family protein